MTFIAQFANELIREIDEQITSREHAIKRGIVDMHEYWRCVGVLQGLESTKEYIKDLANRAEKADDD